MCDKINPYTASGVFGVSYNGGYKPDQSLKWIPPDTNVIDERDDFSPPPQMPPPNMLMQTCEGRRIDPRVGGIPDRNIQYDTFKELAQIPQVPPPVHNIIEVATNKKDFVLPDSTTVLLLLIVLLLAFLFMTRFSR
jgi:hypothetical protein